MATKSLELGREEHCTLLLFKERALLLQRGEEMEMCRTRQKDQEEDWRVDVGDRWKCLKTEMWWPKLTQRHCKNQQHNVWRIGRVHHCLLNDWLYGLGEEEVMSRTRLGFWLGQLEVEWCHSHKWVTQERSRFWLRKKKWVLFFLIYMVKYT